MAGLDYEMTYRPRVTGPMPTTDGSPLGARLYWEMTEGTLEGSRIKARIAMPGGDWFQPGSDGFGRPDVRVQFVTDDGAAILLHYRKRPSKTTTCVWRCVSTPARQDTPG